MNNKKCVVVGAGFAGLSAAASLAGHGYRVTVFEKNAQPGGRARVFKQDGFVFDMGPSWYWMPQVIERFFNRFGRSASDYFSLVRIDPSYQIVLKGNDAIKVPADFDALKKLFEQREPGSGSKLERFLREAQYKYDTAMDDFVYRPFLHAGELLSINWLRAVTRMDLFRSVASHARRYFRDPALLMMVEFPSLFLGARPSRTPALYSMMNYADMRLGTWYPMGGMYQLVSAMEKVAREQGVHFRYNDPVSRIESKDGLARRVVSENGEAMADAVVAASDYHHTEQSLLAPADRSYNERFWKKKTMAPSCLLYYVGVKKKLKKLQHHNLFFDEDFDGHARSIYREPAWPEKPLFYACCPSVTDHSVAPAGMENLFLLIPVAAGLADTEEVKERYFNIIMRRLENFCGENISGHIVFKRSYASSDFIKDYNAYKGNAYGLANTLGQTAIFKPAMRNRKIKNLYFAGQLTVPGPGVPPSIISGQVAADCVQQSFNKTA